MRKFQIVLQVIVSTSVFLSIQSSWAFRISPMVVELSPDETGGVQVFKVENNGSEKVAIKFEVFTRDVDEFGKETRSPADVFLIYPDQLALEPNDTRNVRVTYNGPRDLLIEKSYRFIASQLPVKFGESKAQSQLGFLFQYVASVYVKPKGASGKLEVLSAERAGDKEIAVRIKNSGTARMPLRDMGLLIRHSTDLSGPIKPDPSSKSNMPGVEKQVATGEGAAPTPQIEYRQIKLKEDATKKFSEETIFAGQVRTFKFEVDARVEKNQKIEASLTGASK